MAGVSKEEITVKQVGTLLAMVLLLAWSASAQTGTQSQSNAGASSSTNVNADKGGVQHSGDRKRPNSKSDANGTERGNGAASTSGDASLTTGTTMNVVLTKPVDSRKAKEGDEVTAKTTSDTKAEGQRTIPKGTKLIGHVTKADARAKGDSDSSLGIVFDRAAVGKGREVPVHAVVHALAVARTTTSAMADDSMGGMSSPPPSGGSTGGPSGGLVGGAVNNVSSTVGRPTGAVANTAGQVAGNAAGTVNNTVGSTAASVGSTTGATLNATSQGVIGLPGYTLDAAAANATQGSVITSSGKNVKLDSGTQMVLRVVSQ